ncbi:putative diacylglycerol O-acyltransferase [Gamsiella multidivaricata]|uniref:putative diacylglycerol O-acyltransferase n=1 Tax=Gamsiella multidivaricata TaxID=101098 RepID=UPI00221FE3C5|nr:putative diacylglycerol O-acyltransferase [Gamsiella multidivaricata]KAI7826497.1 putative diacylglycerol O-acyltransferase [Gamsiella multidivaricata]
MTGSSYRHTFPVHTKTSPSPLSKEAPPESYRGFVNLGMLLLFGNNVRLIIENYQKYGILISLPGSKVSSEDWLLTALAHVLLPLNVLVAFQLERWARKWAIGHRKRIADTSARSDNTLSEERDPKQVLKDAHSAENSIKVYQSIVGWLHAFNVILTLSWSSYMSYYLIFHPFMSMTCLINGTIQFFKLTSYALVHQDLRAAYIFDESPDKFHHLAKVHSTSLRKDGERSEGIYTYDVQYPANVTIKNMAYYWLAPTLCYQPSYPRTTVFRKSFFLKRILEVLTCFGMMYFLIEQYATPTLQNSVRAVDQLAFGTMLERVLKLSTTSVLIWLLMFYTFFHATFNALAEMLYFGDRCFYLAWWNAGSVAMYWRLWNKPIYTFFKRHVYLPMVTSGISAAKASLIIFTLSAIMHEIVIGLPTHMIYGYAFGGMLFQIPLIALTRPLEKWRGTGTGLGNMVFWVSFTILGQPACALLYYYHWTKRHIDDPTNSA